MCPGLMVRVTIREAPGSTNRSDFYNLIGHSNDYAVVVCRIGTQSSRWIPRRWDGAALATRFRRGNFTPAGCNLGTRHVPRQNTRVEAHRIFGSELNLLTRRRQARPLFSLMPVLGLMLTSHHWKRESGVVTHKHLVRTRRSSIQIDQQTKPVIW